MQEMYFESEKDDVSKNLDGQLYKGKIISNTTRTAKVDQAWATKYVLRSSILVEQRLSLHQN